MYYKRFKTTNIPSTDGTPQQQLPLTPWHGVSPTDEITQLEFPSIPWHGILPTDRAQQQQLPLTPLPGVPPTDEISRQEFPSAPWDVIPTIDPVQQLHPHPTSNGQAADRAFQFPVPPVSRIGSITVDRRLQEHMSRYANWLTKQAEYETHNDKMQEINNYIQDASKIVKIGGKEVITFAPFRPELSALQTFTRKQIVALCVMGILSVVGLVVFRLEMLVAVIAAITVMYFSNLILNVIMALKSFRYIPEEQIDDAVVNALKDANWPQYTILCPLYREAQVVPQFVKAMQDLDYPTEKLQVLFLTEVDDVETRNAIRALSLPSHYKIVTVPDGKPRTKPRACNYGLMQATGSYIVIFDAEDIPDPLQLKKAVLTFANHGTDLVCIQAKLNFYNVGQNLLTRWFTAEYSVWFDLILPGLQLLGFSLPLGGTSNHFRTTTLRALGGWDAYNVTEDCDLGLRLSRYRLKTVVLNSTTYEEANSQLKNWLRQRSRWIKGYMQTYLVHMRHPLEYLQKGRLHDLLSFQTVVGSATGVLFINPLMWALLAIYMAFGPQVLDIYHILFPGPILYMGAFCLIFGNFFYMYLYLLGCVRRREYRLMTWTLFIPFYWSLISLAGAMALFELLVKPHYWQKTVHGLHLKGKQVSSANTRQQAGFPIAEVPTTPVQAVSRVVSKIDNIPSVTTSLKAVSTLLMPAISPKQKQADLVANRSKVRDLWLFATVVTACIASIIACWYYFQQHEVLLYGDSLSHLRIARGVFDSLTPGLAQLGTVWLPLPHILMWPFIWNNYLWHSGLAGSFVSMPCYIVASIYVFLSARRLTHSSSASFIGTLAFILNPNVLYLQATPLSETVCMATLAMTGYYFLTWIQEGTPRLLVLTAGCAFLATLARYDGWAVFLAIFCLIPVIGWMKRQRWPQIQGNLILFGALGGLGIALWFIWNKLIFGDPLYFQRGQYSSQAQQVDQFKLNRLFTYHDLWQSIRYYAIDTWQTVGLILFVLAFAALVCFILRYRLTPRTLGVLVFLVPFAFYVVSLYGGQAIIWVPGAVPLGSPVSLYNVRYGAQMVAPVALLIATLLEALDAVPVRYFRSVGRVAVIMVIIVQSILITSQGIISLQEGESQYNYSCPQRTVSLYLAEHYNGGKILQNIFADGFSATDSGMNFKNIIYEGSGQFWLQALRDPANLVDWIIVNPSKETDVVGQHIDVKSPLFLSQFTLVMQQTDGIRLYHHTGRPPLPTRVVQHSCILGK